VNEAIRLLVSAPSENDDGVGVLMGSGLVVRVPAAALAWSAVVRITAECERFGDLPRATPIGAESLT
jgi:hypothetical protein